MHFISQITGCTFGELDGNALSNKVTISNISIPTLNLPASSYILMKWYDLDRSCIDYGVAKDDVSKNWMVNDVVKPEPSIFRIILL